MAWTWLALQSLTLCPFFKAFSHILGYVLVGAASKPSFASNQLWKGLVDFSWVMNLLAHNVKYFNESSEQGNSSDCTLERDRGNKTITWRFKKKHIWTRKRALFLPEMRWNLKKKKGFKTLEQLKFGSILWKTHESSLFSCKFWPQKSQELWSKPCFFFLHCDSTCKDENLLHTLRTSNSVKSGFYFEITRDFVLQVEQRRDCELCRPLVDSTCTFRCPRSYETISFDNNFLLPFCF